MPIVMYFAVVIQSLPSALQEKSVFMISRKRLAFLSHTGSALASNALKNIIWRWLELPGRVGVTDQASTTWPHRCLAGKRGNWGQTRTPNRGLPLQNQALDFTPRVLLLCCNRDNRYSAVNSVCFLAWCSFLLYQGLGFLCWGGGVFSFFQATAVVLGAHAEVNELDLVQRRCFRVRW